MSNMLYDCTNVMPLKASDVQDQIISSRLSRIYTPEKCVTQKKDDQVLFSYFRYYFFSLYLIYNHFQLIAFRVTLRRDFVCVCFQTYAISAGTESTNK